MNLLKKALFGAAIAFGLAGVPATAATFQVTFNPTSSFCSGTGSFTADPSGGAVTDFLAAISCGGPNQGNFVGTTSPTAIFTPPSEVLLQSSATINFFPTIMSLLSANVWTLNNGFAIHSGTYEITAPAVPIPAALPLLAAGLGALGFTGWRRKRKAV